MENERIIKITSLQTTEEGEDTIEVTTRGTLSGDDENYTLEFDEIFEDGLKSHTILTVRDGKSVNLLRRGDMNNEIILEAGRRHNFQYGTPYGEMQMGVFASTVENKMTPDGGTLKLVYTIDFYGNFTSGYEMLIEVGNTF